MRVQCGPRSNLPSTSLSSLGPVLMKDQHIQEVNRGILPKWANHQTTVQQVLRQVDLERKEQQGMGLQVVSEWACLRILLEHTGDSEDAEGCWRKQEAGWGLWASTRGRDGSHKGSKLSSMHILILKRARPDLRLTPQERNVFAFLSFDTI